MCLLYDVIYLLALLVGWPLLIYRRWTRGPSTTSAAELLGRVPSRPVAADCVWIHGVSLGEVNAARTLVAELRRRRPEAVVVVSSTTATGRAQARRLFPHLTTFRFPVDLSFAVRTAFDRVRPSVIVLMELEVWPNLIEVAAAQGVPVVIANGRVTESRTMRLFRKPIIRAVAQRMFRQLSWVGAQDRVYARRFAELGVPQERIEVTGSVKYDAAEVADRIEGQDELAAAMGLHRDRPLWVCGSTGPGEESIVLDVYAALLARHADLQLAIVPRKPERFDEVAHLIVARGFACLRRSSGSPTVPGGVVEPRPVALGDTVGELRKFYALADVVFVGRSLVPLGGSDMMEVAGLAKPMLVGPYTENFSEAMGVIREAGGCRVVADAEGLREEIANLLADRDAAARMGAAARAAILLRRGATKRTIDAITRWLGAGEEAAGAQEA